MASKFTSPPPTVANTLITFPAPHVLLVTLNRPRQLNAIPMDRHAALAALWDWYDAEPSLRCAVVTGAGRAFCAGADLREWDARHREGSSVTATTAAAGSQGSEMGNGGNGNGNGNNNPIMTRAGFGGLANRAGKKPVVAAVNGLAFGGGMEMVINADLVVASEHARFGLPEVTIGVVALAGALPRLVRTAGRQRAAEMALLGRTAYTAAQMREWGLVNLVVPRGEDVVAEALRIAGEVAANSPDAVIASREGLRLGWEAMGPELAVELVARGVYGRIDGGENMAEGVRSFVEGRKPVWKDSKL